MAKHLSQCGWLGTAWLEAPARKTTAIDAGTFRTALAVFLDLPIAGFAGVRCPCGEMLTPETGAAHVSRCKHHGSTGRHNTFGLSWDDVLQSVPGAPKVWVRGLGKGSAPCIGVRWVRERGRDGEMVLVEQAVYPDRTYGGMWGDAPAKKTHADFVVPDPCAPTYCERGAAATVPLYAAGEAHRQKERGYSEPGLISSTDAFMPVAVELHGGLHESVIEELGRWSRLGPDGASPFRAALLLRTWRFGLAVGLMHGRVGQIEAALRKLDEQERRAGAGADKQLKAKKVHAIGRELSALVDCAGIIRAGPSRAR